MSKSKSRLDKQVNELRESAHRKIMLILDAHDFAMERLPPGDAAAQWTLQRQAAAAIAAIESQLRSDLTGVYAEIFRADLERIVRHDKLRSKFRAAMAGFESVQFLDTMDDNCCG